MTVMASLHSQPALLLAARRLYLDRIEDTHLMRQVHARIAEFRASAVTRPPRSFPH
jgi:hypothetical protein